MSSSFKSNDIQALLDPYTHGLEKTYAIQHIDLNTVRLLQTGKIETQAVPVESKEEFAPLDPQFKLPLGEYYEELIHPFWIEEPIEILGLSNYLESCLKKHECIRLRDVISVTQEELMYLRGIGQGHLEELFSKLKSYTETKPKDQTQEIDPIAWFRSLFADLPKKLLSDVLHAHGLYEKIPLIESRQEEFLSKNRSEEDLEEAYRLCGEPSRRARFMRQLRQICQAFLMPWMRRRGGIASEEDLLERLENISRKEFLIRPLLGLFRKVFTPQQSIFATQLVLLTPGLYADNTITKSSYASVLKQLNSYFYHQECVYEVERLLALLRRESARKWSEFDEMLFRRLIILNSEFHIEKESSGISLIRRGC